MNHFTSILKKEIYLFFIGTSFFLVSSIFSTGLFLLFRFTYPIEKISPEISSSILWAVHLISSIFAIIASQEWEWEAGALRSVKLSGIDPVLFFLGKAAATTLTLILLWTVEYILWGFLFALESLPVALLQFFPDDPELGLRLGAAFLPGVLASMGIALLGQLTSVLAVHSRFKHALMFILFFPLALPLVIAGSGFTREVMLGKPASELTGMLTLQAAFLLFFLGAGIMLFEYLWEE